MHRTYGCSANPHRSRPLCDFCGRKFCQPQKLKVHIKRMHSGEYMLRRQFYFDLDLWKIYSSNGNLGRSWLSFFNTFLWYIILATSPFTVRDWLFQNFWTPHSEYLKILGNSGLVNYKSIIVVVYFCYFLSQIILKYVYLEQVCWRL